MVRDTISPRSKYCGAYNLLEAEAIKFGRRPEGKVVHPAARSPVRVDQLGRKDNQVALGTTEQEKDDIQKYLHKEYSISSNKGINKIICLKWIYFVFII